MLAVFCFGFFARSMVKSIEISLFIITPTSERLVEADDGLRSGSVMDSCKHAVVETSADAREREKQTKQ